MINIIYKNYGLRINAVWFCKNTSEFVNHNKADIIFFHGVEGAENNNLKNCIVNLQHTLLTDLQEPLEEIFKQINKNYRYEINRSKKENIECIIYGAKDIKENPSILINFKKEYEDFTSSKGIANTYNESAMKKYIDNDNVILTKAFKNEQDYAQHIYVCDDANARLLYSISNFRIEGSDRNLVGRANKLLHWEDIEYLKNNEFKTLDWGGISSVTNPNGVDIFKKGFAGQEKDYYNIIIGNSYLGRLAILAKKLKRG